MLKLSYPLFDGEKVWAGATVTVEDGRVHTVEECDPAACGEGFLLPGLIDAHTHMGTDSQVTAMVRHGVTTTCDVSASAALEQTSPHLTIHRSAGMAMGMVAHPAGFVAQMAANGAKYIKVLLFNPLSIGKAALRGIVDAAHAQNLKVAVHATEVATVRQAVEAGADILLHVPMKKPFPQELAETIARKGIAVAPTLVMMETFAQSGKNGYKPAHYQQAEETVKLLHDCGVSILAATDANPGNFAPAVDYGHTLHEELERLVHAGLTPVEALAAATSQAASAFGLEAGRIAPGQPATMVLVNGRPDQRITDSRTIQQIWVKGASLL